MVGRNNLPQKVVKSAAKIGKYQAAATILKKKKKLSILQSIEYGKSTLQNTVKSYYQKNFLKTEGFQENFKMYIKKH